MKRTVAIIIAIFVLLNISSFFIMAAKTPKYTVFTGAVHYPPDYLYYLSFITQGKEHWLLGANLKSGDTLKLDLLNWMYVFGGHVGSIFHLPAQYTYQILVIIASICYLISGYYLISLLFPTRPTSRLVGYMLFLLSNAFPKIYLDHGSLIYSFYYPFNNLGHPFIRLTNVPHHLFISAGLIATFIFAIQYWQNKKMNNLLMLGLIGAGIAGMQPLQWAFITGVIGISGIFAWWKTKTPETTLQIKTIITMLLPAIILFLLGIPFAMYIKSLFTSPLYIYMMTWEKQQQVYMPLIDFIILNGPVMLLGFIGYALLLPSLSLTTFPLFLYSTLSIALFFSPIPEKLGFMNLRVLSVIPTLTAAYISASILWSIVTKIAPNQKKPMTWFLAFLLLTITIPVTLAQVGLGRPNVETGNTNIFLPLGVYQTFQKATQIITQNETTLVTPQFALTFPAFTGRHVFSADAFGTINFLQKNSESELFVSEVETTEKRVKWLKNNNISYIFTYAWTPINLPNLSIVYKNDYAILYKVTK
jgi:hypothetical protein